MVNESEQISAKSFEQEELKEPPNLKEPKANIGKDSFRRAQSEYLIPNNKRLHHQLDKA